MIAVALETNTSNRGPVHISPEEAFENFKERRGLLRL